MARTKKYPGVYERKDTKTKSYYFLISTTDPKTGKRKQDKSKSYSNPEDAYKDLIDTKDKQMKGKYIKPTKITLKEWVEKWLGDKELSLKKKTLQSYTDRAKHIIEEIGHIELFNLTKDDVHDFYRALKKKNKVIFNGKEKVTTNKKLSSRTVHDTHKVLKMALIQAYRDERIPRDIASQIESPKAKQANHNILKPDEVNLFLNAAKGDQIYCAVYLAIFCGLRQAETLGLTWGDVDLDNQVIYIVRTLDHEEDDCAVSDGTKTDAGKRPVEIDEEIVEVLRAQKRRIEKDKELTGDLYQDMNLVCPTNIGTPMNPSNLRRSLYRIIDKAGVTRVTYHELRHSHASLSVKSGADIKSLSFRLGHSSTRVTLDIYSHLLPGMQKAVLKKFRDEISDK
ncbi:tyrosine-type recombinase/integrase [Paenibacillus oryzisoli]|uniref:tyrosine-type recombinase/integrase n=1 Tax=Paenibacillus oryzisoli TaxID=1850517 RepID=UPI003D27F95F